MKLFQSRLQSQQAEWSRTGKLSIGHVLHKYLTRICRIDYKSEYKLPFSLCFLSIKKLKGVLGYFDEVISVTVAIPTSGVVANRKAINRQRFTQISHKNLQDRL